MRRGFVGRLFIIAVCTAGVLALGAFYFFGHRDREAPGATLGAISGSWEPDTTPEDEGDTQDGRAGDASLSPRAAGEAMAPPALAGWSVYENFEYGFLFRHPSMMRITEFSENGGGVVLAEGAGSSFQVFISAWDEPEEIVTPARIAEDLPDFMVKKPQTIALEGGGRALLFEGEASEMGTTREVWIVHSGFLYQISAPLAFDATLSWVMATWRFE